MMDKRIIVKNLKTIEWVETFDPFSYPILKCPACENRKEKGHKEDCWLHKAIKEGA